MSRLYKHWGYWGCVQVHCALSSSQDLNHRLQNVVTNSYNCAVGLLGCCQGAFRPRPVARVLNFTIPARHCWCPDLTSGSVRGRQHIDESCASPFDS